MSVPPIRGYLGISEVLAQLRAEFPDISVSKIRFLETEGLIAPARSPAGYRRFCTQDVDRLRFVLAAQRDQYLPLRVIRERLARLDQVAADPAGHGPAGTGTGRAGDPVVSGDATARGRAAASSGRTGDGALAGSGRATGPGRPGFAASSQAGQPGSGRALAGYGLTRHAGGAATAGSALDGGPEGMLSRRELLEAAGLSEALLTELETFGLLRRVGRQYAQDAVEVARTAVALTAFGVEARHLRAVRAAAERESTMIESLVAPILRQRGSGARELAGRTARDCAQLVLRLHCALVDGALTEAGLAEPAAGGLARQDARRPEARGVGGASA